MAAPIHALEDYRLTLGRLRHHVGNRLMAHACQPLPDEYLRDLWRALQQLDTILPTLDEESRP